jgi:hypothetical protein
VQSEPAASILDAAHIDWDLPMTRLFLSRSFEANPCQANPGCESKGIVIGAPSAVKTTFVDKGAYYELRSGDGTTAVTVRATKSPALLFSMYAGTTLLWAETAPLSWNTTTTLQTLGAGESPADTHIFGGGMQVRPVVESPCLQFIRECQRFGPPPRLNK